MKQWLFGGEISTGAALFPLDAYKGRIVTDLFGETGYFGDLEQFWRLKNEAVAAKRDAFLAKGWSEVVVLDVVQFCTGLVSSGRSAATVFFSSPFASFRKRR